jgi:hypothetical protein
MVRRVIGRFRSFSMATYKFSIRTLLRQRIPALFFVTVMLAGVITPFGPWVASARAEADASKTTAEKLKPLQNDKTQAMPLAPGGGASAQDVPQPDGTTLNPSQDKPKERDHEDVGLRTATTKTYVNKDGTRSMEYSALPKHYMKNGKWEDVVHKHNPDSNYKSPFALEGESLIGRLNPLKNNPQALNAEAGDLRVAFLPYADGVKITLKDKTFTMKPAGARNVRPVITETEGGKVFTYKDAWPGVDVDYEIIGTSLKETIILKRQGTQNAFVFAFDGTKLKQNPKHEGTLALEGISEDEFFITPLTVNVNQRGMISEQVASQTTKGKTVAITVDAEWLKKQPKEAFPIAIDPSF